jgi:hypothetical protein
MQHSTTRRRRIKQLLWGLLPPKKDEDLGASQASKKKGKAALVGPTSTKKAEDPSKKNVEDA